jgi:hypothetical protein
MRPANAEGSARFRRNFDTRRSTFWRSDWVCFFISAIVEPKEIAMRLKHLIAIPTILLSLQGCVAAGLTVAAAGAGVGMGTGVEHTLSGIVYKTFSAPANNVRLATLKSLDRMGMPLSADEPTESGWRMVAMANDRTIEIELEKVTNQVTRMRVVANKGDIFFKDSSTATEVVLQTADALQDDEARSKNVASRNAKRKA